MRPYCSVEDDVPRHLPVMSHFRLQLWRPPCRSWPFTHLPELHVREGSERYVQHEQPVVHERDVLRAPLQRESERRREGAGVRVRVRA